MAVESEVHDASIFKHSCVHKSTAAVSNVASTSLKVRGNNFEKRQVGYGGSFAHPCIFGQLKN